MILATMAMLFTTLVWAGALYLLGRAEDGVLQLSLLAAWLALALTVILAAAKLIAFHFGVH